MKDTRERAGARPCRLGLLGKAHGGNRSRLKAARAGRQLGRRPCYLRAQAPYLRLVAIVRALGRPRRSINTPARHRDCKCPLTRAGRSFFQPPPRLQSHRRCDTRTAGPSWPGASVCAPNESHGRARARDRSIRLARASKAGGRNGRTAARTSRQSGPRASDCNFSTRAHVASERAVEAPLCRPPARPHPPLRCLPAGRPVPTKRTRPIESTRAARHKAQLIELRPAAGACEFATLAPVPRGSGRPAGWLV